MIWQFNHPNTLHSVQQYSNLKRERVVWKSTTAKHGNYKETIQLRTSFRPPLQNSYSEWGTLTNFYSSSNMTYNDVNLWACHYDHHDLEDGGSVPKPASLCFSMHWNSENNHYCGDRVMKPPLKWQKKQLPLLLYPVSKQLW